VIRIRVTRGEREWSLDPRQFDGFAFEDGDQLAVLTPTTAKPFPVVWGDTCVPVSPGVAVRVPAAYTFAEFKGFRIPSHLIALTGAGADTLQSIGEDHIAKYRKHVGMSPDMTIVDLGCGIGRDAFQLLDYLDGPGRYIGVDVTRDSIVWAQRAITPKYPRFTFHHLDAYSELYNPFGAKATTECRLPVEDAAADRVVLASVFTHLLEDEVRHYLREFRRVLKPNGMAYASFFLYTPEALQAAKLRGNTAWAATFEHVLGDGVYGNDPTYPRGAVAYTDAAMQRMLAASGMRLVRPYLKGWWSGLHGDQAEDGQDVAILMRAS
jgi:ubiquinone/menaquinone biosynthesis C-methylase UbiE